MSPFIDRVGVQFIDWLKQWYHICFSWKSLKSIRPNPELFLCAWPGARAHVELFLYSLPTKNDSEAPNICYLLFFIIIKYLWCFGWLVWSLISVCSCEALMRHSRWSWRDIDHWQENISYKNTLIVIFNLQSNEAPQVSVYIWRHIDGFYIIHWPVITVFEESSCAAL